MENTQKKRIISKGNKRRVKTPISSTLRRTKMPDKKLKIIRVRLQDRVYDQLQKKADRHTKGNVSQYVRYCILKNLK